MYEQESTIDLPIEMRREHILAHIKAKNFVRVTDLSAHFGVSEVTVRGDLDNLAEQGHIRRVRGGAMPQLLGSPELPFEESLNTHKAEKGHIGRLAASLVRQHESLILDTGTTTASIARALLLRTELRDLVIFTNALTIALELEAAIPRISVVVTGGTLRPRQHSLVSPLGREIIQRIHAHTIFIGCNGVDPLRGVTNANLPEAEMKQWMLKAAKRRIIVADGSKIGNAAVAYIGKIEEFDILITDTTADPEIVAALRERGLEVLLADNTVE